MPEQYNIITTREIRERYARTLEELIRQRNKAAYDWSRLHWWQWRKRRRLERVLFGTGGWAVEPLPDVPARLVRGRFGREKFREEQ